MYYMFDAENITRKTATALVRELEDKGIVVEYANVGRVFENNMELAVNCLEGVAKTIRARIWELNQGLCCDMSIISEEVLDSYC